MPSKVEAQTLQLLVSLYAATDGRPMLWRALAVLNGTTDDGLQHAIDQGWVIVEGGHSVCLTDQGRERVS